ncbi:hypothetical protein COOONC_23365, partial [Cooperia oncophora]
DFLSTGQTTGSGPAPHPSGIYTSSTSESALPTQTRGNTASSHVVKPLVSVGSAPQSSSTYAGSTEAVTVPTSGEEGSTSTKMTATVGSVQHPSSRYTSSAKEFVSSTQGIQTGSTFRVTTAATPGASSDSEMTVLLRNDSASDSVEHATTGVPAVDPATITVSALRPARLHELDECSCISFFG